jgi:stage II sporulation protein D
LIRALAFLLALTFVCHGQVTYKVRIADRIVTLPAEQYVAAVLAGESSVFQNDEALKAMAVAARTYAANLRGRHAREGFDFCSTTHCQRLDLNGITERLTRAAQETAGELLWFDGKPAFTVYTRSCGGEAEDVRAVWPEVPAPYLLVHADPYCLRAGGEKWAWAASPERIVDALRISHLQAPAPLRRIDVVSRTQSGRNKTLSLAGDNGRTLISASSFRFALGRTLGWNTLRSERYEIENNPDRIVFHGSGEGHGVGLCQRGADEMASEGRNYRDILAFYYPGTALGKTATGFPWTRLGGEGVAIFTTEPDRDRNVLMMAKAIKSDIEQQLPWRFSPGSTVAIYIYPNLDAFRNATGEPGWVAARTVGKRIDLQPAASSRETLHHELLHVLVESHAAPGLPVWFREGVVEWLADRNRDATPRGRVDDTGIRQRTNRAQAEQAYQNAQARVSALIARYGEPAVLGWVARGVPEEVRNSTASSPQTNSR